MATAYYRGTGSRESPPRVFTGSSVRLSVNGRLLSDFVGVREDPPVSWCAAFITHLEREVLRRGRDGKPVIDVEEVTPPGALVRRPR